MINLALDQASASNPSFSLPETKIAQLGGNRFDFLEIAGELGVTVRAPQIEFSAVNLRPRSGLRGVIRGSLPAYVGTLPSSGFTFTQDFDRIVSQMLGEATLPAMEPGESLLAVIDSAPLSTQMPGLENEEANSLNLKVDPSVLSILSDTCIFEMLSKFLGFLGTDAIRTNIKADLVAVRGFFDPEDETTQITVTLYLYGKDKSEARQFHDDLGRRIDAWLRVQSAKLRDFITATVSLFVRTTANA